MKLPLAKYISLKGGKINPDQDWQIVVLVFVVVNICIIGYALFVYYQIHTGDIFNSVNTELAEQSFTISSFQEVVSHFEAQEREFVSTLSEPKVFPEPF